MQNASKKSMPKLSDGVKYAIKLKLKKSPKVADSFMVLVTNLILISRSRTKDRHCMFRFPEKKLCIVVENMLEKASTWANSRQWI